MLSSQIHSETGEEQNEKHAVIVGGCDSWCFQIFSDPDSMIGKHHHE